MLNSAFLLACLVVATQEESVRSLVEKLGSDRIEDRAHAARELRRRGRAAADELERAARAADREVAERAREILRTIPSLGVSESRVLARVPEGAQLRRAVFGPGGDFVAFVVRTSDGEFAELRGKWSAVYERIEGLTLSPDGSRAAYIARRAASSVVVVGDRFTDSFDEVWPPAFSADGRRVGFGARAGRELRWIVVEAK